MESVNHSRNAILTIVEKFTFTKLAKFAPVGCFHNVESISLECTFKECGIGIHENKNHIAGKTGSSDVYQIGILDMQEMQASFINLGPVWSRRRTKIAQNLFPAARPIWM